MKYTVIWRPKAIEALAHLWNTAPDRKAVTIAADRIDYLLKHDPENVGESRSGTSFRILFEEPLVVFFQIVEADRMVLVLDVIRM